MKIDQFLRDIIAQFETAGITTARLDAQVLLGRALKQNRAWVLAHGEDTIPAEKLPLLTAQVHRRARREPLAYILGQQEFYGRNFTVTPNVLIPRPETEGIIEQLKALPLPAQPRLLDVGTGSGAIAITAALELPDAQVAACDISPTALQIAQANAERLGAHVYFFASDLLNGAETYHVIAANLPYVVPDWPRSPETNAEPALALFAADNGLALIKKLIAQAPAHLHDGGFLLLEADPRQFAAIQTIAATNFTQVACEGFTIVLAKRAAHRAN